MEARALVHHGLAIKRHASATAVAELVGLPIPQVTTLLTDAVATGRAVEVSGAYTLTPLARVALEGRYSGMFAAVRTDAEFVAAYEAFEALNHTLKQTITQWQTIQVGGSSVPNDHSDKAHDAAVIDRLGQVQEQLERIVARLARRVPRLQIYSRKLLHALEAAEDGDSEWVSDIRRESYHTVWFELHEDLLRIMGRVRED